MALRLAVVALPTVPGPVSSLLALLADDGHRTVPCPVAKVATSATNGVLTIPFPVAKFAASATGGGFRTVLLHVTTLAALETKDLPIHWLPFVGIPGHALHARDVVCLKRDPRIGLHCQT